MILRRRRRERRLAAECSVVAALARHGGLSMVTLQQATGLSPWRLAGAVASLEADRLIRVTTDPRGRRRFWLAS